CDPFPNVFFQPWIPCSPRPRTRSVLLEVCLRGGVPATRTGGAWRSERALAAEIRPCRHAESGTLRGEVYRSNRRTAKVSPVPFRDLPGHRGAAVAAGERGFDDAGCVLNGSR